MKRYAPLLTLIAVAVLGVALLTITSVSNPANRTAADQAAVPATQEPAADAPAPDAPAADAAAAEPVVAEKAYAGRTADRRFTVAIAVKDGRAVAYVCDGKKVEAWLEGTLQGDQLSLAGKDDIKLTGTVSEAKTDGTFTGASGTEYDFSTKGVSSPAGLYEGRATSGVVARVGWVVEEDGTVTGVVNRNGETAPAPALDPANPGDVTIDGVPVTVTNLDGNAEVVS